jgi:acyl transferase domain-containing protein/acyl carrier protein
MACLLPGADGLDEFWSMLVESRAAIGEYPPERLNRELYFDPRKGERGKTYATIGGLVPPRSPRLGDEQFDISHRLFCDVVMEACQQGHIDLEQLRGRPVGVYVGHSGGGPRGGDLVLGTLAEQIGDTLRRSQPFQNLDSPTQEAVVAEFVADLRRTRPHRESGGGPPYEARWAAELVARTLGLEGPNLVIDAACASSLVATALGALALQRGEVETAIVGGASYAKTDSLILFSQAQSCSSSGTRPFDDEADGLVGSEGYVALILKTEQRARQDGDKILAVIRGIGLSSDGRGRHLWAPLKEGQMAALRRAYAHNDPGRVQYIETHATSTQLGDATEIESLREFFRPCLNGRKIPIGSVKSNIGHTLETAGLAGLLKVILAMQREVIPATVNLQQLNRKVDWSGLPFEVTRQPTPWPRPPGDVRRAAVSAFGIGGLNVHLVVEEPHPESVAAPWQGGQEPIAIVGRGLVVAGAHNLDRFRANLQNGHSALVEAPEQRWPGRIGVKEKAQTWATPTCMGGFVVDYCYDYLKHRVPPKHLARANPLQFMLLDATEQALNEAGPVHRPDTTVVVGTLFGGEFGNRLILGLRFGEVQHSLRQVLVARGLDSETLLPAFEDEYFRAYPALLDETGSFTSSTLASRITKAFDLEGGALALEAGECSSSIAVATAMALLQEGVCSAVICAGAQASLDLAGYETLGLKGCFEQPGYFPGEGVGVVVLKRLHDAQRDGNPIFGVLLGAGCAYAADDPARAGQRAAEQALQRAGLSATEVGQVEVGGGAPNLLRQQATALALVYPDRAVPSPPLQPLTGHLAAAEGLVSLIRSTLLGPAGVEGLHGQSESGLACHLLLAQPPNRALSSRCLRWGGADLESLRARLSGAGGHFDPGDRVRVAMVLVDPAHQSARLALAQAQLGVESARVLLEEQGIFWAHLREPAGRVAFVFAGQGSQYPAMLRELVQHSPAARSALQKADRALHAAGQGSFAAMAWNPAVGDLHQDPVTTQLAVLVADILVYAAVREQGVEPHCVCGHSFGEIAALVAAEVLSLEQAIEITLVRARALLAASPEGGLLSVQASPDQLVDLLDGRNLYLTHRNAPQQTVVGGNRSELAALAESLAQAGIKSRPLQVPGALHTPMVQSAQPALRQELSRHRLLPPTRLFYSNVTNSCLSDPHQIAANLVAQLVEPIDYPGLVRRLVQDGVRALVEIGPGQVLTRLHRSILEDSSVVCVASDHPQRAAMEQLQRMIAALDCSGLVVPSVAVSGQGPVGAGDVTEFDATLVRRGRRRATASPRRVGETAEAPPVLPAGSEPDSEWLKILLDFVVDLTGYPREAISLDWDLEADLGIDSIKRTQLLGEVGEATGVEVPPGTSLDSFRTLRQLHEFMSAGSARPAPREALAAPTPAYDQAYQLGRARGLQERDSLRQQLQQEMVQGGKRLGLASASQARQSFSEQEWAELQGMADGAGVHVGALIARRLRDQQAAALSGPITHRYVMRMVAAEPHTNLRPQWHGAALVLGDGPLAERLQARLQEQSVVTHRLSPAAPQEQVLEGLDRLWSQEPLLHLFLTADPAGGDEAWASRRQRTLITPFWLCQRWLSRVKEAGRMEQASLVGMPMLGGDFAFQHPAACLDGGVLTGLFKAILIESWVAGFRHLPVKLIDSACDQDADRVIDAALGELANPSYECEVGWLGGSRQVVRPHLQPAPSPRGTNRPTGRWICTGGARGITAYVAAHLGQRYGLTLHLIGRVQRQPIPERWRSLWPERRRELKREVMEEARLRGDNAVKSWESAQKILEMEETLSLLARSGVQAHYHCCDIGDREALRGTLEEIRGLGPIRGILQGAGSSRDAKFEDKEPERVEQCFRAKIDGTLHLMELTAQDPLTHFVAFGSISGRFGANGHADYSTANDMLAKRVDGYRRQRPEVASLTFHWHAWGDVGMATRAETQLGLQRVDMQFMPAAEGLQHLVAELEAGCPEAEVLITDDRYYSRFYPREMQDGDDRIRPLLGSGLSVTLDPDRDIFLREHRLDGQPMLPLVIALELACEAALESASGPFRVTRLELGSGLKFSAHQAQRVWVELPAQPAEACSCLVAAEFRARDGSLLEGGRSILRATVQSGASPQEVWGGSGPALPWQTVQYSNPESRFYHGPAFQALRQFCVEGERLWGRITAPALIELAGDRPDQGWRLPCAVLDACLYAVGCLAWYLEPGTTVPSGLGELRHYRLPRPREACGVEVRLRGREGRRAHFDFQLVGRDGELLIDGVDYQITWLTPPSGEFQ